jgi:transcriptional regulator with XRE-family HTH domain
MPEYDVSRSIALVDMRLPWRFEINEGNTVKPFEILRTNIYMLCRLCGWSIADLAKKSGIGITSLYRWMNGKTKNPAHTIDVADTFARALRLEITVADLWDRELSEQKVLLRRKSQ